jgi:hypothetical protein
LADQYRKQRSEILDWLASDSYETAYADSLKKRQPGTGEWFLRNKFFVAWRNRDIQTLFCPGIPGAGKTIIASIVIEHLWSAQPGRDSYIAFLFCNYSRQEEQTAEGLLAMLLRQLAEQHPLIFDSVKELYACHREKKTRPDFQEIYDTLCNVTRSCNHLFLVVDALDECSDDTRRILTPQLRNLQKTTGAHLMATSRYVDSLEQEFKGVIQVEIRAGARDINMYLDSRRVTLPGCIETNSALWQAAKDCIIRTVDGMCVFGPKS